MLGTELEFSSCESHGFEIANSGFLSDSAIFWLSSATSRTVIPRRNRISRSCSPGFLEPDTIARCYPDPATIANADPSVLGTCAKMKRATLLHHLIP